MFPSDWPELAAGVLLLGRVPRGLRGPGGGADGARLRDAAQELRVRLHRQGGAGIPDERSVKSAS